MTHHRRPEKSRTETILLVDDDDGVRDVTRDMLLDDGYVVLDAASGTEALRLSRAHHGKIDLLVTDVMMHGMDGPTLAESFARLRADAGVLFISGYTADALNADWLATRPVRFLSKPFSSSQLTRQVRAALECGQANQ